MVQLADVFEGFRSMGLDTYGLDHAYYLSAAQMRWDAMLKFPCFSLELMSDRMMLQQIEFGIRRGAVMI